MLKTNVARQGDKGVVSSFFVRHLPGPEAALPAAFAEAAIRLLLHTAQRHGSLIHLRLLVHHFKDALRAGQCGQDEIHLLGALIDRHGALPDIDQVGSQASDVHESCQCE